MNTDEYLFLGFIAIPILFLLLKIKLNKNKSGLRSHPIVGTLPDFIKNKHRLLEWTTEILSSATPAQTMVLHVPIIQTVQILTSNPLNVEHILKTNSKNYPKGELNHFKVRDFLGDGIFNSDGENWHFQRKMASLEFNKRSLRNFIMEIVRFQILHRLIPVLDAAVEKGTILDLQDVLQRFAFDNICKLAFNVDTGENILRDFMKAFDESAEIVTERFLNPVVFIWRLKRFLNIGTEKRLKESMKIVDAFAYDIIRTRKPNHSDDLLSRFAAATNGDNNNNNNNNTEQFLRDVVINFITAGRQTTSSGLVWFFWLLSSNPGVELKILEEIKSIKAKHHDDNSSSSIFNFDQLREMDYLHAAISESLRLYPPVYIDTQTAAGDDVMPDGTHVKKGAFVSYCGYSMGRTESIWGSDCCEFKPERWLVNGVFKPESPFKFTAFHAGPRMCLGKEMSYIQMKSVVVCLLDKFKYVVANKSPPELHLSITLRMKNGLPVQFQNRETENLFL
ncbi:hypothetical protein ZOSMA_81G01220 [Zostera marina]|uniref:Cytochrome P450 n=1 Tax=Zostera marina TaxID=29655 RepID=A0A0K9NMB0_ZOSMR|nr:hypothetical protein ZOSMA_81G01220 [Zostera marina]